MNDTHADGDWSVDLIDRLQRAEASLLTLAAEDKARNPGVIPLSTDEMRLRSKAEGVRLALSYVREAAASNGSSAP